MKKILALSTFMVLILTACQMEGDMFDPIIINDEITTDYLLAGDLDAYMQGEQVFREKGKPGIVSIPIGLENLSDYEDCFVLYISNGSESDGTVTSAIINLDGQELLNTSDFSGSGVLYDFEVCNLTSESILEVEVRGEPGTYIEIWMEGKLISNGTFIDARDGKVYKWVKICNLTWMAENLAYLPSVNSVYEASQTDPRYYVYGYNGSNVYAAKASDNYSTHGVLYNWPAAMNTEGVEFGSSFPNTSPSGVQGACPDGWHLPSDDEWEQLALCIANENDFEPFDDGWLGVGDMLKSSSTTLWPTGSGTDDYGFSAVPGGYREYTSHFYYLGNYGIFWSTTESFNVNPSVRRANHYSYVRHVRYDHDWFVRYQLESDDGLCIRCIKDY